MKDNLKQFFEAEKHYVKVALDGETDLKHRDDICWYARQRALGAVDMAQMCGLKYEIAEKMFYKYCDELEEMKNEML